MNIRLLLVEDAPDDAELIVRALRRSGYHPEYERVDTADDFEAALTRGGWDLIICDHSMPRFNPHGALSAMRSRNLDLPFLVVSGTLDEDAAVSLLRSGAHDFITKQNLARLGPAVSRELQDAEHRAARRQAQSDLQAQRDLLRLVLDVNPNLIFVIDADGRFVLANQATADLYGTTIDSLIGQTAPSFGAGPEQPERREMDDRILLGSGCVSPTTDEAYLDARTNSWRWFDCRRVPLRSVDGAIHVLVVGTEVTERKQADRARQKAEEQLRQSQKMEAFGQLAGGIAHDFNNVLTAILGYGTLLRDRFRDAQDVAADIDEITNAGERASSLTRQLLAFSRKQLLDIRVLDLNDVVADVERMLRRIIGDHIRLDAELTSLPVRLKADRSQIEQVLVNLAVNARDAMPRGGTLTIRTRQASPPQDVDAHGIVSACNQWVALLMTDTGCGMPPDVQARIFEPFFTTKAPGKGTGLGLSTVYGIVAQSGGRIHIESQVQIGTTIGIYLPRVDEPVSPESLALDLSPESIPTETILVVEDDDAIRELVRKGLSTHGYTVLDAAHGEEAKAILAAYPGDVHLLLTDIRMPGMSGPDLAQWVASTRKNTRVLYMSGFTSGLGIHAGTVSAHTTFLHKQFTVPALLTRVRQSFNDRSRIETTSR